MLDFAFGSATNIVTQTMSSMSFWQMSTLSLLYNERCCSRIGYMWENNYKKYIVWKDFVLFMKRARQFRSIYKLLPFTENPLSFFCKKIPTQTSFNAIKQLFPLIYSLITFGIEVVLVLKVISVTIFLCFNCKAETC